MEQSNELGRSRLAGQPLLISLLLCMGAFARPASAQDDEDGPRKRKYTPPDAEWIDGALAFLRERHDGDGDGRITRAEYRRDDVHWKRLDRDGDGVIAAADWQKEPPDQRLPEPIRAPGEGSLAPQFNLREVVLESDAPPTDLTGTQPRSYSPETLVSDRPALVLFANNTAPQARNLLPEFMRLAGLYGDNTHFVVIVGSELHPLDGPVPPDPRQAVPLVEEPTTTDERVALARKLAAEFGLAGVTVLVDQNEDLVTRQYRGKSGRLYLLRRSSRLIAFRGEAGKVKEQIRTVEERLRTMLGLDPLPK